MLQSSVDINIDDQIEMAKNGDGFACYLVGRALYRGENGLLRDYNMAFEWFTEGSRSKNSGLCLYMLALCYAEGHGVQKDPEQSKKLYELAFPAVEAAAERGEVFAQCALANYYYFALGKCKEDFMRAVEWYKKSADNGYAAAQYYLGYCYFKGRGVEQNREKAAELYQKAAEDGYAEAQCNLGYCYYTGKGVTQDYKKAFDWYSRAAEHGSALAIFDVGQCYFYGHGTDQDIERAIAHFSRAAKDGNAAAQYNLGFCYYYGRGVEKNLERAIELYEKAAEGGDPDAQNNLGFCYFHGIDWCSAITRKRGKVIRKSR